MRTVSRATTDFSIPICPIVYHEYIPISPYPPTNQKTLPFVGLGTRLSSKNTLLVGWLSGLGDAGMGMVYPFCWTSQVPTENPKKSVVKPSYPPMSYHKKKPFLNFRGETIYIYIYNNIYIYLKKKKNLSPPFLSWKTSPAPQVTVFAVGHCGHSSRGCPLRGSLGSNALVLSGGHTLNWWIVMINGDD